MKNEKEITITVISQFQSNGNESKKEVRIPEFKAMMRFWWRALVYFDDDQIEEIKNVLVAEELLKYKQNIYIKCMRYIEGIIFGDTQTNASPIEIRLKKYACDYQKTNKGEELTFIIKFVDRKLEAKSEMLLNLYNKYKWGIDNYIELLEITSILGSVGGKARKGYGAFKIENIGERKSNLIIDSNNICNKINHLFDKDLYSVKTSSYIEDVNAIVSNRDSRIVDYPYVKEIFIGEKGISNIDPYINKVNKLFTKKDIQNYNFRHKRFTNPVYITITASEKNIKPILTVLNNTSIKDNKLYEKRYKDYVRKMCKEVFRKCIC